MKERETKTITTEGGHIAVLKTYITGREARAIENAYINDQLIISKNGESVSGVKVELINKVDDTKIISVLVSINSQTENLVDALLDLPSSDCAEIKKAIEDTISKKNQTA